MSSEVLTSGMTAADLTARLERLAGLPRQLFHMELTEQDVQPKGALKKTQLDDIINKVNVQEGLAKLSMLLHHKVFLSLIHI